MNEQQRIEFERAALPLIKWLAENVHPHHYAIVENNGAELVEGRLSIKNDAFIRG